LEHQYALPSQILSAGFAFVFSLGREPSPVHAKPSRLSQSPVLPRPPTARAAQGPERTNPPGSYARASPTPYGEFFSFRKIRAPSSIPDAEKPEVSSMHLRQWRIIGTRLRVSSEFERKISGPSESPSTDAPAPPDGAKAPSAPRP
jgi:hypothetical protein